MRTFVVPQCTKQVQPFYSTSLRFFAKKTGDTSKDKKEKEKAKVAEEFEGKELDDIKNEYSETLEGCHELLEETLANIKSGRASTKIFDDLEIKAYGETQLFVDLAQTVVQGSNNLIVKVFDEGVKDEVLKAL